ncbi:MAG: hypothetical protein HY606_10270 [Planctomycetes bacterium]|nr:hypothetical protein [Planctomycetota bacterium]
MKLLIPLLVVSLFQSGDSDSGQYPKKPWELDFKVTTKPTLYKKGKEYYWYFVYEIKNITDVKVPNLLDISMYVEIGRQYLSDREKVDIERYKKLYGEGDITKRDYQTERFGTLYTNLYFPDIEIEIIAIDAGLNNRNRVLIEESIDNFRSGEKKGYRCIVHTSYFVDEAGICGICEIPLEKVYLKGLYLNPRNLRVISQIEPAQTLHCIAIFHAKDVGSQKLDIQVRGLRSNIDISKISTTGIETEDKPKVLHLTYDFSGDPYNRLEDVVTFIGRKWDVRRIGPQVTKEQLNQLLELLIRAYQMEKKWERSEISAEEVEKLRFQEAITGVDINIAFRVFQIATDVGVPYQQDKGILENKDLLFKIQEWWIKNRSKVKYDYAQNKYIVEEETNPQPEPEPDPEPENTESNDSNENKEEE